MEVVRKWKQAEKEGPRPGAERNTSRFQRWAERYIDDTNQEFMYEEMHKCVSGLKDVRARLLTYYSDFPKAWQALCAAEKAVEKGATKPRHPATMF